MKIYLLKPEHPIYESLVKYPPKGVKFVNVKKEDIKKIENLRVYKKIF